MKEAKELLIDFDPFLPLVVVNVCFVYNRFMVLKKWMVLVWYVLIHGNNKDNCLRYLPLMFFGDGEVQ